MDRSPGVRPRESLWHMLDTASRYALPGVQTLAVLLLLSAPDQPIALGAGNLTYRPASLPAPLVFAIGLLLDLLAQSPVGIEVLVLLLIHAVALRSRRVLTRSGFVTVWLAFAGVALGAALLEFLLVCLLTWRVLPAWPGAFEFGIAAGLYPFLAFYLIGLHRGLAAPERAS